MLLVVAVVLASCSGDDGGEAPPVDLGEPYFAPDFQTSYAEVRDCRPTLEHVDGTSFSGAVRVQVLASPDCSTQYLTGVYPMPQGAVLVKRLWRDGACADLLGYVVMRKGPPGTAPSSGDWEWQEVSPDLRVLTTGVQAACITCHTDCTDNRDFTCTDP